MIAFAELLAFIERHPLWSWIYLATVAAAFCVRGFSLSFRGGK